MSVPEIDPVETFDLVATAKDPGPNNVLLEARDRVLARYAIYRIETLNELSLFEWTDPERAALLLCYNSAARPRNDLRGKILKIPGQYCPYCSMDRPTTVDHYVPKDEYPEFSVYPPNLVAVCSACNTIKRETWMDHGSRLFLHPYFDHVPNDSVLVKASISWPEDEPVFSFCLVRDPKVSDVLFDIIASHVERLKLLAWYEGRAEEEFDDLDVVGEVLPVEDLKTLIHDKKIVKHRRNWGPLSWRAAIWAAVLRDDRALKYLQARLAIG